MGGRPAILTTHSMGERQKKLRGRRGGVTEKRMGQSIINFWKGEITGRNVMN